MREVSFGLGLGVGYVLGAQAGRARYEQIKRAAAGVLERPDVQQALGKATTAAPAPLRPGLEKLSRSGPGGQGPGVTAEDRATSPPETPQAAGGSDAPLPDPLVPPARSGTDPTTGA